MKTPFSKKIFVLSACILLVCALTVILCFGTSETKGDVNGDNSLDEEDCDFILALDAGLNTYSDDELAALSAEGDVNGDGIVDAGDAILIKRYISGLIASYDETEPEGTETTTAATTAATTVKKAEVGTEDDTNRDIVIDLR